MPPVCWSTFLEFYIKMIFLLYLFISHLNALQYDSTLFLFALFSCLI